LSPSKQRRTNRFPEECFQFLAETIRISRPTLPEHKDFPAVLPKRFNLFSISFYVPFSLVNPIIRVGGGRDASMAAVVPVPEAAVDEYYLPARDENEVRFSRKGPGMQCIAIAH
jgi:hypothetical protein